MRKGFSLLEALVAMVIAFIVLMGLLAGLVYATKVSLKKAYLNEATRILNEKLEELHQMDFDDVNPSLNNGATSCGDALSGKNAIYRQIRNRKARFGLFYQIAQDPDYSVKKVDLEVCWKLEGKFHSITGSTVVRAK